MGRRALLGMLAAYGGLPPRRPDQHAVPAAPGLLPAPQGQFVVARRVVVFGAAGSGVFVYSPVPGAGNLIASIAGAGGTDPYGNVYQGPGFFTYSAATFMGLTADHIIFGPRGAPAEAGSFIGVAGIVTIQSPTTSGIDVPALFRLLSSQETGDGVQRVEAVSALMADANVWAPDPANAANREVFHNVSSAVGFVNGWLSGGRVAPQFRLVAAPPNSVDMVGSLTVPAGFGAGQAITNAFSAAYRTVVGHTQSIPAHDLTNDNTVWLHFGSGGVLTFDGPAASTAAGHVLDYEGRIYTTA